MKFFFVRSFLFCTLLTLNGCVIAPFIDAYSQIGLSQADRQKLLGKQVKTFNDDLYWGKPQQALQYVKESERQSVSKDLKKLTENVKIIDTTVDDTEFLEDSHKAKVSVKVRFYKVPYYVVQTRSDIQHWEFDFTDGWRFVSREHIEDNT